MHSFFPQYFRRRLLCVVLTGALSCSKLFSQDNVSASELKKLSVEELMNIRVTLVSRTPQPLTEAASAIQVITGDDIRRSGATNLPEALRLVSNVQVAQLNSNAWIVGVRGFNTLFANKLLVMIDGRTIYTPLFGGVIWDLQNVLLEDVERIEVVSGPGGTLWGANAVNGVINIVTKRSHETQGTYVSAGGGNFLQDQFEVRHGGKLSANSSFKVYGMHFDRNSTFLVNDTKNTDEWQSTQFGFRMDFNPNEKDALTLQGDLFFGNRKTTPEKSGMNGQNISGTWARSLSPTSGIQLNVYYDRYHREDKPGTTADELNTIDADFQHHLRAGKRHEIVWGLGYRFARDNFTAYTQNVAILPGRKSLDMANAFIQDQFSLSEKVKITGGTKVIHNVYTGLEFQPGLRLSYLASKSQNIWAAISRAIRTPSRFDRDYYLPAFPVPPTSPSVAGGPSFESEKLNAYEIGYRIQPTPVSTFSASVFYHRYPNLYSVEALPGTLTYQIMNGSEGKSWGAEIAGAYQIFPEWKVRAGYTYIDRALEARPGHNFEPDYLANDAKHRFLVHSILDLPGNLQVDLVGRYMDNLPPTLATASVPDYFMLDARLAWAPKRFEIAFIGQNLAHKRHAEFGEFQIPRSVFIKLSTRF